MIDGKLIDGTSTVSLEAPSGTPKQDILMSDDRPIAQKQAETQLGDCVSEPILDLSLGDLSSDSPKSGADCNDDSTGENKDALTNNDDPKPSRKVTGKKRRMGRRRLPSGAE